ncbi:MAG: TIGR00645 family protein [Thioploca sp.]|nr:TIGR00645 family protein [Thioploca sp.]
MKLEKWVETSLFNSRWLLAPLYIGLAGALFLLLVKFIQKFAEIVPSILESNSTELLLYLLGLIDIVLIANLLLIIIFSGYENFVSKIDMIEDHVDRPDWMGKIDYTALKLKVIGSIVAISSIELLKVFISIQASIYPDEKKIDVAIVKWLVIIHLTFVISGVLFAVMERILHPPHAHSPEPASESHHHD